MTAQIRHTIELLSKILRENGASKVKAETFRQAKFDQDQSVPTLWRLLFELLYYCEYGKIDDVAIRAWSEFSSEEQVVYVKREMAERGFYSRDFANLPGSMSSGSRELLLGLGWLLCKENILQRFMTNCTSPLDDDTEMDPKDEEEAVSRELTPRLSELNGQDLADRVHQLLWLNGKLRLNLRSLHSMQNEKNRLKHKIRVATLGVSTSPDQNHLSMLEVYMLRHPEILKKNLKLLERDSERLENLLSWRNHEDTFWKWMESVLDAKLQNRESVVGTSESETTSVGDALPAEAIRNMCNQRLNLKEAILKYEEIVENLEKLWQLRSTDVSEEELDSVLASIDLELSIQRASIAVHNTDNYLCAQPLPTLRTDPTFVLERNPTKQTLSKSKAATAMSPSSGMSSVSNMRDVEVEIKSLQEAVAHMQSEVATKQDKFRMEMQNLSLKFENAISVPPMAYNI